MKNQLDHLLQITSAFNIDVEDFYTVTLTEYSISFQGKMSSDKIAKYKEFFQFELSGSFLESEEILNNTIGDEVRVRMILT